MGFCVYKGMVGKEIVYIGTNIQKPTDRFRWHKHNGKNFNFFVIEYCSNKEEMLDLEFKLIREFKPRYNKIKNRKQNFNKKLSDDEIKGRIGSNGWCQCCFRRRVNSGYNICYFCSKN